MRVRLKYSADLILTSSSYFLFSVVLLSLVNQTDATSAGKYGSENKSPCSNLEDECKSKGKECWVCPTGKPVCVKYGQRPGDGSGYNPDGCLAEGAARSRQQGGRSSGQNPSGGLLSLNFPSRMDFDPN